ncbi:hypothetical protein Emag_000534 [Eimeria magna]
MSHKASTAEAVDEDSVGNSPCRLGPVGGGSAGDVWADCGAVRADPGTLAAGRGVSSAETSNSAETLLLAGVGRAEHASATLSLYSSSCLAYGAIRFPRVCRAEKRNRTGFVPG